MISFLSTALAADSVLSDAKTASGLGGSATSIYSSLGSLIGVLFGVLGIIFLLLVLRAGFMWMTAQGDPKAITKAKDIMIQAVVGLVILLSAYSITEYVFGNLILASGGTVAL